MPEGMNQLLVGYARVSTEQQDLTAQRDALRGLGVGDDRIYVDHGLTGTNRERPDARDILAELTAKNVRLSMGGAIHDPADPIGRLLFNVLAMVAEFEADLIRTRTRDGMRVAKAKGHLRGKQPKLTTNQAKHLLELSDLGTYSTAELAELFGVGRSTIYRTLLRVRPVPADPHRPFADRQA